MLSLRIKRSFALGFLVVGLCGCISGLPPTDTYKSSTGAVTDITSDRESCVQSCNADFGRCNDSDAAHRSANNNAPSDLFGAKADCRADLKSCLPRCKGR